MRRFLTCGSLIVAAACATVGSTSLVPADLTVGPTKSGTVLVIAEGTPRKLGIGRSLVSSTNLREAVEDAIEITRAFTKVVQSLPADWRLEVQVEQLEDPEWSLEMTAKAKVVWRLVAGADGRLVSQREIETKFKATPDHANDVQERGRIAVERAVRENVAQGIQWVVELDAAAPGS